MRRGAAWAMFGVSVWAGLVAAPRMVSGRPELQVSPLDCRGSIAELRLRAATVVSVTTVTAGPFVPGFQTQSISVPALCQVIGYASPSPDSRINFELWIPAAGWNRKLVVFGNGGYASALGYGEMLNALRRGFAVMGGDTGHTGGDLQFVVGHPERMTDWGTRSVGEIAKAAKPVVTAIAGSEPSRTYFSGCSTGGHQGYSAVQHYPDVFDGVVAGAPGNNRTRLNVAFLARYRANRRPGDDSGAVILPASKLPAVAAAVTRACDATDGLVDGLVDDPRRCQFDPASLLCPAGRDEATCLTPPEKAVVDAFYTDIRNPRTGALIYPAFPRGAEAGFNQYWGTTEPTRADYWRTWVFGGAPFDWWTFDYDRHLAEADRLVGPRVDQVNADITAFEARGGKLIIYNGWNDPVVNAIDTIAYYERVRAQQGSQAEIDRFARLFLVPGMGHCGGGTGTSSFDMLAALDAWVDRGVAPDSVLASRLVGGVVSRTRPLCPYPRVARYAGSGSIDEAANFRCVAP